jgi:hypothetical protein
LTRTCFDVEPVWEIRVHETPFTVATTENRLGILGCLLKSIAMVCIRAGSSFWNV